MQNEMMTACLLHVCISLEKSKEKQIIIIIKTINKLSTTKMLCMEQYNFISSVPSYMHHNFVITSSLGWARLLPNGRPVA